MNEPASKSRRIDLVYATAAGQIESMRRGRSHGNAGTHDTNAREGRRIAVDAPSGSDEIVCPLGYQAAHRDVVYVVVAERLPQISFRPGMQFDGPRCSSNLVSEMRTRAHLVGRQLVAPDDPTSLPDSGEAIGTNSSFAECVRKLILEEADNPVGLVFAFEPFFAGP